MLDEAALLAETKRPTTATARGNCSVLRLSRATFLKILDRYPEAASRPRERIAARDIESVRAALAQGKQAP